MAKKTKTQLEPSLLDIELVLISPSKTNPRKSFDVESIKELAESMKQNGLLQPITVRADADGFELVAGERRYRAAQLLKWERIPAIVREVSDEQMLEIQILENLQREDVSPIDEANAFQSLLKKESLDWLCSKIHKSKKYVSDRLKLVQLNPVAQQLLGMGKLPLSHAVLISKLLPEEQVKVLDLVFNSSYVDFSEDADNEKEDLDVVTCSLTLDDLKERIEDLFADLSKAPFDLSDETLNTEFGSCNACPLRTSNSQLLFADITEDDKCTNVACFKEKTRAHLVRCEIKAKEDFAGTKVLKAEYDNYSNGKQVKVGGKTVEFSEAPAKGLVPVIITKTDGYRQKALGKVVYIKPNTPPIEAKKQKTSVEDQMLQQAADFNANVAPRIAAYLKYIKPQAHLLEDEAIRLVLASRLDCKELHHLLVCCDCLQIGTGVDADKIYGTVKSMEWDEKNRFREQVVLKLLDDCDTKTLVQVLLICEVINAVEDFEGDDYDDDDDDMHMINIRKVYECAGWEGKNILEA